MHLCLAASQCMGSRVPKNRVARCGRTARIGRGQTACKRAVCMGEFEERGAAVVVLGAKLALPKWTCDRVSCGLRAVERCCVFLRRESGADELTCDRHGASTKTLHQHQPTMMMMHDACDDAVAYLDVLRACAVDDAAVLLTCAKESMIFVSKCARTHATDTRQFAARRYSPASRELGAKRRPAEKSSLSHCLH
jgi:hypothetical protein